MEHDLHAAHRVVNALVAAQLPLDHLDVETLEVRPAAGGEVVEDANRVAALDQSAGEIRADEAGSARDEHLRHPERHRTRFQFGD